MSVLITGGAGFIGSHLVEKLVNIEEKIIVLDNFSTGTHNVDFLGSFDNIDIVKGCITDSKKVNQLVSQCSEIYQNYLYSQ